MPAATVNGNNGAAPGAASSAGVVPFIVGSNHYGQQFFSETLTLDSNSHEYAINITPGGFLRGVTLIVRSTNGELGTGGLSPDAPWNLFDSISLENIDGSPIRYPMGGYAAYLLQKYGKPWLGDPSSYSSFSNSANPSFDLTFHTEIRDTAGVLANTDARAQYRLRFTVSSASRVFTEAPETPPDVTITGYMDAWSQPDREDLHGNSIQALPDGLSLASICRHQFPVLNGASADNTFQFTNTGNELRNIILVVRDGNGDRRDYLADPIRFRLDNRSLWSLSPDALFSRMNAFYPFLASGTSSRETGVYVIPRYRRPGDMYGEYWLGTSNATYLILEAATVGTAVDLPGTVEMITDEVVPVAPVPVELEGV
jgi:hypothetical protein